MLYKKQWEEGRKEVRKVKKESLYEVLSKFKNSNSYQKLSELIELYLDAHDLVTKIGSEISEIVDIKEQESKRK